MSRFWLSLLFVLSGVTSLIYQSLWIRVLALGVGSTSAAMSMVLAVFFLGLSLGSERAGKLARRTRDPLVWYGWLEGAIGLYSLALMPILFRFHTVFGGIASTLGVAEATGWVPSLLKLVLVLLLLLGPTAAMGATLPLLVRALVRDDRRIGSEISRLYGVNTLGAVLGALVACFALIPWVGVLWANALAAAVNVGIFVATRWLASRSRLPVSAASVTDDRDVDAPDGSLPIPAVFPAESGRLRRRVLLGAGATGFGAIAAEVVWNKYLAIYFGTNLYGLGIILALFLAGICLGALAVSRVIDRIANREAFYIGLLAAAVAAIWGGSQLLTLAPMLANVVGFYLGPSFPLIVVKAAVVGVILLVPTSIFGALFPTAVALLARTAEGAPRATGLTYSVNTLGSILGSCLAGLVIIPAFGSSWAIRVALLAIGGAAIAMLPCAGLARRTRIASGLGLASLTGVALLVSAIDYTGMIKSAYHQRTVPGGTLAQALRYFAPGYEEIPFLWEGKTAVVSLTHDPSDGPEYRRFLRLKTNGLNESGYDQTTRTVLPKYEGLLGFLPYTLVREPRTAFVVGYGGGYTVDYLTGTDLREVYVAELEQGVLKAADFAYPDGNPVLTRPNLKLRVEDARYVLATGGAGRRDLIVSQPSHSWLSGVANLFTLEFFEIVRGRLTDKGVFAQWLNLYNINERSAASILRTFFTVFPHGAVFTNFGDDEMILIGSLQPLRLRMAKLEALARNDDVRRRLADVPFNDAYDLVANFSMGRADVLRATAGARINTDVNAYAEVNQSRIFYAGAGDELDAQSFIRRSFTGDYSELFGDSASAADPEFRRRLLEKFRRARRIEKFEALYPAYAESEEKRLGAAPADAAARAESRARLGVLLSGAERHASALPMLEEGLLRRVDPQALRALLESRAAVAGREAALADWRRFGRSEDARVRCRVLEVAALAGDRAAGERALRSILARRDEHIRECGANEFNRAMGTHYATTGAAAESERYLIAAYQGDSRDLATVEMLVSGYYRSERLQDARTFAEHLHRLAATEGRRLRDVADLLTTRGRSEDARVLEARAQALAGANGE